MKTKLYAFPDDTYSTVGLGGCVVTEKGVRVTSHFSSNIEWLKHDLGVTSDYNHHTYNKLFGVDGWELIWSDTYPYNG